MNVTKIKQLWIGGAALASLTAITATLVIYDWLLGART